MTLKYDLLSVSSLDFRHAFWHGTQIQDALQRATVDSNSQLSSIFHVVQTKESPPTFYETNKFTAPFQEIVNAYG